MENDIQFEVEAITPINRMGIVIFAKSLSDRDFFIKPGLLLNGCEIKSGDIPRALGEHGQSRKDLWGFLLRDSADQTKFKKGGLVSLSQ